MDPDLSPTAAALPVPLPCPLVPLIELGPLVPLPPGLRRVRDIEWFDGPILTELVDDAGGVWLWKWASCAPFGMPPHRYLMTRASAADVIYYTNGIISMAELLRAGGDAAFLVDEDRDHAPSCALAVSLSDPAIEGYLPEPDAMSKLQVAAGAGVELLATLPLVADLTVKVDMIEPRTGRIPRPELPLLVPFIDPLPPVDQLCGPELDAYADLVGVTRYAPLVLPLTFEAV